MTLHTIADTILKRNYKKLKVKAADVNKGEVIHEMRVAIRRIRSALKLFRGIFPPESKKVRKELQDVRRILGKKRDLDIFLEFTKTKKWNEKADLAVLAMLESKSYAACLTSLKNLRAVKTKEPPLKVARKWIRKTLKRVLNITPSLDDKTLHKLRIAIKKLRYLCEFFAPICSLDVLIEKTIQLQDILGEHQDAITGIALLNRHRKRFSPKKYLEIQKKYALKKQKALKAFSKTWEGYWENENSIKKVSC